MTGCEVADPEDEAANEHHDVENDSYATRHQPVIPAEAGCYAYSSGKPIHPAALDVYLAEEDALAEEEEGTL
jgi:hypothetical protein